MNTQSQTDVLIIGAGPSGTITAAILHKAGLSVQIVEKTQFPRFVIGESLLPRCMDALEEAGFMEAVKAKNFQQKDGAKFVMDGKICDFNFSQQFTPGWKWTWQVPRAEFDKVLADECEKRGIPIAYETEVVNVQIYDDHSITSVTTKDGKTNSIRARFIVDGSGYGRVLPRLFGLDKPSNQPPRKAVFCHMTDPKRDAAAEPDRITIYVHDPKTWIWVIPFSNGNTSVGYVGDPSFFDKFEGTPTEIYRQLLEAEPDLKKRFSEANLVWPEPRILQSWSSSISAFFGEGYVLTGNVTEFLDPVFSSGVTLASVSAQLAAGLVIRHLKGEQVNWKEEYQDPMEQGVDVFRTYVNGWYDGDLFTIFFASNPNQEIMSQICSVLAGYVWDESNPFVKNHEKNVRRLSSYLEAQKTAV